MVLQHRTWVRRDTVQHEQVLHSVCGSRDEVFVHSAVLVPRPQGAPADSVPSNAVGEVDPRATAGFTVGTAPQDARPHGPRSELHSPAAHTRSGSPGGPFHGAIDSGATSLGAGLFGQPSGYTEGMGDMPPMSPAGSGAAAVRSLTAIFTIPGDRNAVFRKYKNDVAEGRELAAAARAAAAALRDARASIRSLGDSVNGAKRRIDELGAAVGLRRSGAPAGGDGETLDAETYALVQVGAWRGEGVGCGEGEAKYGGWAGVSRSVLHV